MKILIPKKNILGILVAILIFIAGSTAHSNREGVIQVFKNATAPFDNRIVNSVPPVAPDTVLAKVPYQGGRFRIETRKNQIERFNCSQCHNNQKVTIANAVETAHGDILLDHGDKDKVLACFTCHDQDNRDFLITEQNIQLDIDHSYLLCGQCHFRQKKDWIGGAHGKRVSWWAGERVVKNCTACHNPHSPRFEKRWPQTYSRPFTP